LENDRARLKSARSLQSISDVPTLARAAPFDFRKHSPNFEEVATVCENHPR